MHNLVDVFIFMWLYQRWKCVWLGHVCKTLVKCSWDFVLYDLKIVYHEFVVEKKKSLNQHLRRTHADHLFKNNVAVQNETKRSEKEIKIRINNFVSMGCRYIIYIRSVIMQLSKIHQITIHLNDAPRQTFNKLIWI